MQFTYDGVIKPWRRYVLGQVTSYGRHSNHRLQTATYMGRPVDNRCYAYDAMGNLLWGHRAGQGGKANVDYARDGMGRVFHRDLRRTHLLETARGRKTGWPDGPL